MDDEIWILIPMMGMAIPIFAIWMKHRERLEHRRIDALAAARLADPAPAHLAQVKALEERVRVLEAIVTDGSHDLATRIEALRPAPPLAAPAQPAPRESA